MSLSIGEAVSTESNTELKAKPFLGKRIIITGASKGLGLGAAQHLTAQGAGLTLLGRSEDLLRKLQEELPMDSGAGQLPHHYLPCDFLDHESVEKTFRKIVNDYPLKQRSLILHAAGGGLGMHQALATRDEMLKVMQLNFLAPVQINGILLPEMIEKQSGTIVHVGSIASYEAVGSVSYNVAKASLNTYVRSLGKEMAKHHITITGILPGGFAAPMNAMIRLQEKNPRAYEDFVTNRLPRQQMGRIEEMVPILSLLLGENNGMFSSCMLPMDAGEGRAY